MCAQSSTHRRRASVVSTRRSPHDFNILLNTRALGFFRPGRSDSWVSGVCMCVYSGTDDHTLPSPVLGVTPLQYLGPIKEEALLYLTRNYITNDLCSCSARQRTDNGITGSILSRASAALWEHGALEPISISDLGYALWRRYSVARGGVRSPATGDGYGIWALLLVVFDRGNLRTPIAGGWWVLVDALRATVAAGAGRPSVMTRRWWR